MQIRFLKILLCLIAPLLWWHDCACGHEFEDGHVERSVDIVVRNRDVQLKYAIGLSDSTIVDWLAREELLAADELERFHSLIDEYEKKAGSNEADGESEPDTTSKPVANNSAEVVADPAEFQTEIQAMLQEKLGKKICDNLKLTCNDSELEFRETVFSKSSRHHVTLEITAKTKLPDDGVIEFAFNDLNFLEAVQRTEPLAESRDTENAPETTNVEQTNDENEFVFKGNVKLACRVKGKAVLLNSNVAPVLARAKVSELGPLSAEERLSAASILVKIAFAQSEAPQSRLSR